MNSDSNALWSTKERRASLGSFAAFTLLIAVFLLGDASSYVNSAGDQVIGHVGASAGLTMAAAGTMIIFRRRRPDLLTMMLAGAALTAALELGQLLTPTRTFELRDGVNGFGGVLLAVIGIEILLRTLSLVSAARVHAWLAAIGSLVLVALLVLDLAPEIATDVAPDGQTCPFTMVDGTGQRISLASASVDRPGCLVTESGGLGIFGPVGSESLTNDTVLLSSPLGELAQAIIDKQRLVVGAQVMTGDFRDEPRGPGTIMILGSATAGEIIQLRTQRQTAQAIGASLPETNRSLSYAQVLEPNTRYQLRLELTATEVHMFVDGDLVASNTVNPAWLDQFADPDVAKDLTLYIGNSQLRTLPFNGVIEWIEIDT